MKKKFVLWIARVLKVELQTTKHVVEHSSLTFDTLEHTVEFDRFDTEKMRAGTDTRLIESMHLTAVDGIWESIISGDYFEVSSYYNAMTMQTSLKYKLRVAKAPNS